jgi:hypothetical protein
MNGIARLFKLPCCAAQQIDFRTRLGQAYCCRKSDTTARARNERDSAIQAESGK